MSHTLPLHTTQLMPTIGLGTWNSPPGAVKAAVEHAILTTGYRHIDCAAIYGNEPEVGAALTTVFAAKKIKREDIFITSKLWNTNHTPADVEKACRQTLKDLNLKYLDLYLMHWGLAFYPSEDTKRVSLQETWRAMEALVKKGLVKAIGVANFTGPLIIDLLSYAKIKPAVNQIELHPYNAQPGLVEYCQKQGIVVTAYSPLGSPGTMAEGEARLLDDEVIQKIATKHKKSPAQVAINWAINRGTIPIPKSTSPKRIDENFHVLDFKLTPKEMQQLNGLNRRHRYVDPSEKWGMPYFD